MLKKFPKRYLIYFYAKCRRGQIWSRPWSEKWPRRNVIISSCCPCITCIPALNSSWKPSMRVSKYVKHQSLANAISSKWVPREIIWVVRLSEALASFRPICEGGYASVVAPTPSFDGIGVTFSFSEVLAYIAWFSFSSSSEDPLSEDTSTSEGGTTDFLAHEPYFFLTKCMRRSEAALYVLNDFSCFPSVSFRKSTLKYLTIVVINMPYGSTESLLNEEAFICRKNM